MYRRVVISSKTDIKGDSGVLYHVHGAVFISQYRRVLGEYTTSYPSSYEYYAAVFDDVVRLKIPAPIGNDRAHEFIFDVPENQPAEEAVEEISSTGVEISVYNDHGVLVCRNVPKTTASSAPAHTDGTGEMTSEPIDGTGEMTSEPIDDLNTAI